MNKRQYMQKSFERQRLQSKLLARPGAYPFVVILDHLKVDFNIGKIIRSAEAFGAGAVDVVGTPFFDPLPAKGCLKRVPWTMCKTFFESYDRWSREGYTFFAFSADAPRALHDAPFPDKSAFVLGNEGSGLSFPREHYPAINYVRIPPDRSGGKLKRRGRGVDRHVRIRALPGLQSSRSVPRRLSERV
jgi:tRNA G18 (ribose-2'-O)-methylase SpoU